MNKTEKYLFIGLLIAVVLLCESICFNVYQHYRLKDATEMVRTDTITHRDTIYSVHTDTVPHVVNETVTRYVKISEIVHDTISDSLPIIQKTYADSVYTAYVSGIKYDKFPSLDSINVRQKTITNTITITKTIPFKQKRIHVGVIGGYGYGFTSKQAEPFVGLGVGYSLFSF